MRLKSLSAVVLLLPLVLVGCPDDKPKVEVTPSAKASVATAATSAARGTAVPPSPGGPAQAATITGGPGSTATAAVATSFPGATAIAATNAADIMRYANEKPMSVQDHVNHDMRVRKAPSVKEGDVIVALRAGTPVTKLAKRGQWFLITFADPKDKSRTLAGWTWEQAFFQLSGPGDEKKLCECWKKEKSDQTCEPVVGHAMAECDRTYGEDCKKLLLCVHGELAPTCMPEERLVGPQGICAKVCKRNADCSNDRVCTDTMGAPSVCVQANVKNDEHAL